MNNRQVAEAFIISFFLISMLVGLASHPLREASANPYPPGYHQIFDAPPIITVESPSDSKIYALLIPINFTITKTNGWLISTTLVDKVTYKNRVTSLNITVDENPYKFVEVDSDLSSDFNYSDNLILLSDGAHRLEIQTNCEGWDIDLSMGRLRGRVLYNTTFILNFTVDSTPPNLSNISIENKTYSSAEVPLSFSTNETSSITSYSLDNQANVTIIRNTTIAGLTDGSHSITVYANDSFGNMGKSETVFFSVNTNPLTFPFVQEIIVAAILIIVIILGSVVYLKRRRIKSE